MPENISDLSKIKRQKEVNRVALRMKSYFHSDEMMIQHFVRVYTLAKTIGELEKLDEDEQEYLELAAVVHGVKDDDPIPVVKDILADCGIEDDVNMRVCHLVGNINNYDHIGSLDHQILIEAKMIVDFKENETPTDDIVRIAEKRFITNYGRMFLKRAFDV